MRNQNSYSPSNEDTSILPKFPRRTSPLRHNRRLPHIDTTIEPGFNRQLFTLHECADDASQPYHKRSFSLGSSRTPTTPGLIDSPYSDVASTLRMFSTSYVMTKPQGNSGSYFESDVSTTRQVPKSGHQKPQAKVQNWLSKLPSRRDSPFQEKRRDDDVSRILKSRQPHLIVDAPTTCMGAQTQTQFLDIDPEEDDMSEGSDSEDTGDLDGYHEALFRLSGARNGCRPTFRASMRRQFPIDREREAHLKMF